MPFSFMSDRVWLLSGFVESGAFRRGETPGEIRIGAFMHAALFQEVGEPVAVKDVRRPERPDKLIHPRVLHCRIFTEFAAVPQCFIQTVPLRASLHDQKGLSV
jgi:hypothetical protein